MDHAPGPIIARVAPKVAKMIGIPRPPELEQTIHSSTIVIIVPTTGVHKPTRSSIPATAANMCGTIDANCDVSLKCAIPEQNRVVAVNTRWSRMPMPGQPFGNVENKRCKKDPDQA
jgi:hypothetical protein